MRPRSRVGPASRRAVAGATMLATLVVPAVSAGAETTTRLPGGTNVEKAIAWSRVTFADGAASTVLLARDDEFVDALTSGSVQGLLDAPLLLTNRDTLSPQTLAEINRLDPDQAVVIMGGDQAVSPAVETALEAEGLEVTRVGGATRIETAVETARTFFPDATQTLVARAFPANDPTQAFADAITAGNFSAATNIPILLTETAELSQSTLDYVEDSFIEKALIVGSTAAVSAAVEAELKSIDITDLVVDDDFSDPYTFEVTRRGGANRGETAVLMSNELGFETAMDAPRVLLIEGQAPDAWAGGLTAGAQAEGMGAATVLSTGPRLFGATEEFLGQGADVPLVCGPNVSQAACDAASAALGNEG